MKKLLLIALIATAGSVAVSAQGQYSYSTTQPSGNSNVEQMAREATDKMNNIVQLRQDQYNQVLQLNRNYYSHMQAGPRQQAKVNYGRDEQMQTILDATQYQVYKNARAQGQVF